MATPPDEQEHRLQQEGRALIQYLTGRPASPYALDAYVRFHARLPDADEGRWLPIDRVLVQWACRGGVPARLADAYSRRMRSSGPLRQKLILTLAVLESSPGFGVAAPEPRRSALGAAMRVVGLVAGSVASLLVALPLLGAVHLVARERA
jgi:hypothetical protein